MSLAESPERGSYGPPNDPELYEQEVSGCLLRATRVPASTFDPAFVICIRARNGDHEGIPSHHTVPIPVGVPCRGTRYFPVTWIEYGLFGGSRVTCPYTEIHFTYALSMTGA